MIRKSIHQLKAGDIVAAHGGTFRVIEDARESNSHRPQAAHLTQAQGPSDCAVAQAECVTGTVPGYFGPGSAWTFQGNLKAGTVSVISGF